MSGVLVWLVIGLFAAGINHSFMLAHNYILSVYYNDTLGQDKTLYWSDIEYTVIGIICFIFGPIGFIVTATVAANLFYMIYIGETQK
jgi:hypothetical protein